MVNLLLTSAEINVCETFQKADSQKQSLTKGKHFRFAKGNSCNNYFFQGS